MLIEIFSSSETRRKACRLKASEWKLVSIDTTIISFEKGRKKNLVSARRCCTHTHTHRREQFSVKITRGSSNELEKLSAHVSTLTIFLRGGS